MMSLRLVMIVVAARGPPESLPGQAQVPSARGATGRCGTSSDFILSLKSKGLESSSGCQAYFCNKAIDNLIDDSFDPW
jgi:hypothetical protein